MAWKQILGEEGFVVPTLRTIGIISDTTTLTSTSFAVVMGMTYNFLPFMTLPLYASIDRIDPRTLEASGDLYANGFTTFRKVTLPLSTPGVVAGTLLTFIPAAGDYVNAAILGSPNTKMIGNVIESRYFKIVDYPTAAALSFSCLFSSTAGAPGGGRTHTWTILSRLPLPLGYRGVPAWANLPAFFTTESNWDRVSFPAKVFCWLGW